MRNAALIAAAVLLSSVALPAMAQTAPAPVTAATAPANAFEQDRQSILAQVGDFRVRFDMRETVSFREGYEPLEPKLSGGTEIVRIVYDQGDRISLQHILVMEHEGQSFVIKHWRQDWVYQPTTVLTYTGPSQWTVTPVDAAARAGAWSQTVWQTDDSPRYGGVGRWTYDNGLSMWTSDDTWRPLARRDAVRSPVYDRYLGVNRHVLRPGGWVHIQDNMKLASTGGALEAVVQEDVINRYDRNDAFNTAPGEAYWAATQAYWAAVRDLWDGVAAAQGGIHVQEEAQTGSVTGSPLMELAEKIEAGEVTTEAAVAQARTIIAEATAR